MSLVIFWVCCVEGTIYNGSDELFDAKAILKMHDFYPIESSKRISGWIIGIWPLDCYFNF